MCNMVNRRISVTNLFLQAFVLRITFCTNIQPSEENGLTTNYSNRFLDTVPKNVPSQTTVLDLSHNNISEIWISDFGSLSKMQTLLLSYNLIIELDFSIFQYNEVLEYLDLSHNRLQTVSCHSVTSLMHLDISYNSYSAIPLCPEFDTMLNLKYLGLSLKKLQKSDFSLFAHLRLNTLFLDLEDLFQYDFGILPVFNTKELHIVTPSNSNFNVLSHLRISATESLYLSNIQDKQINDLRTLLLNLNKNAALLNLTLHNMRCDWQDLISILQTVWESTIEHCVISHGGQLDVPNTVPFYHTSTSLKSLTIKQTIFTTIYSEPTNMYRLFANMNITALTISDAGLIHMLCPSKYSHLKHLCFSNNSLTDTVFENCNNFVLLESLILQRNKFKNIIKVSLMTSHMKSLKYLDMSNNLLYYKENKKKCHWGENLVKLNLAFNTLSESIFRCLPFNIQILDLQSNNILTIPKDTMELKSLEEINLASNKLADLPGCLQFRKLRLLNIEMNLLTSASSEFYHTCQSIKELKAGHNPFRCSCELRQFINHEGQGFVKLVDWPGSYMCWYPEDLRGMLLEDFHVSDMICNTTLLISVIVIVTIVLVAVVFFLCFYFHIPWYLKMIWQWTQVKHRNWKNHSEVQLNALQFHAFVSYSEHDSDWVKNVLIPNLEKEDGSIRICQHERNFVAGKSIVENIIDCIEKSYKSIFVLSPNFVQSEWCHYELYFAHHRVFSEDVCGLILLLLEPIPSYMIPSRYHKLKALMAKRTYLEWPKEKSKHGLFWANIRAAIQVRLPNNEEMEL